LRAEESLTGEEGEDSTKEWRGNLLIRPVSQGDKRTESQDEKWEGKTGKGREVNVRVQIGENRGGQREMRVRDSPELEFRRV